MTDPRAPIFAAVRSVAPPGVFSSAGNITLLDQTLDRLRVPRAPQASASGKRRVSDAGVALLHHFESCARKLGDGRFAAYPDPGSRNGHPWTIGWGSTGPGIEPGTIWTQAQCDARFASDLEKYAAAVRRVIGGAPTSQRQFDALVSFHYNTGAIAKATLTKKHKAGDYAGAAREFGRWVFNDGKKMRGLVRRRAAEAALYRGGSDARA